MKLDVGAELRQVMAKVLELTAFTDLSGEHGQELLEAIKKVLKERGEEYRL